jgi:uncharacterized SAM-binding protein YcdF (DUF218 family)
VNKFNKRLKRIKYLTFKTSKWFLFLFGIFTFLLFLLSFTDIPFLAYHKLGTGLPPLHEKPDVIVVMGGSGMPSPDGLIRTYFASEAAKLFPTAEIIIALPYNEEDSLYQLDLMANELVIRGIDSTRIIYEPLGYNTRSQAVNIGAMYTNKSQIDMLIVTTPEHMYRSIQSFKKVGFLQVGGLPTFEKPLDEVKLQEDEDAESPNLAFRYNMWSYLNYELVVLREYFAISYYKLKGWI